MAKRSKRISFNVEKKHYNQESMTLYKKYKIDLSIKELSEVTIYNYEKDLFSWFGYIYLFQDNKSVLEIDEDDLTEYFYYCKTNGNNSRRMKRRMSSISAFYIHLKKKKIHRENPMEYIDRPRKDTDVVEQTFLTQQQVDDMLSKLQNLNDLRLLTYICLGLSTMARVNALRSIKWDQIDLDENMILGVKEKEGYIVDLDFDNYTKNLLLKLREEQSNNNVNCEYVFATYHHQKWGPPTSSTCNDWCKKAGRLINVPTLHNHDLRHSAATIAKSNGANLEDVSRMLNHKGTDVTLRHYIKEDKSKLKEAKAKFGALRNAK